MPEEQITSEVEYRAALREVSVLVDADPAVESEQGLRLNHLVSVVHAYEEKHVNLKCQSGISKT